APVVQQTSASTTTSNGHNPFRNHRRLRGLGPGRT
ncbi:hypothetical protein, partial [Escherichia coli]